MITLKTLHEVTSQQVFDQVSIHLLAQRQRSAFKYDDAEEYPNDYPGCRYRIGTLKCAAGCLIGDDEYSDELENKDWNHLVRTGAVPPYHQKLIDDLQLVHDSVSPERWATALKVVADRYLLNVEAIDRMTNHEFA